MKAIIAACMTLILTGCATLSQLSTYTISNAELERLLDSRLGELQTQASLGNIPLTLSVDDIDANIGPDGRDVIQLGTLATANISVFGFNYPAKLNLSLEGTPYYDSEKKAIFVRSLSLLDSSVDAGGYKGNLAPLSNEVMTLINGYLASNPVYTLDQSNSTARLLSNVPLDLTIEQGRLALKPRQ
ncbi:DUF1439 domain-containing protein [Marinomonas ostreistagni]|uniref:DUF1439 domain-containing protein n=1 Tax=Marinomonas ostreistagni TaxID=359209 RepID=UPI00195283B3|nr:DUF1439 domain-containing protein [Marinomonas ostreistagni]MBM6550090.1 DUF1439 domain-containing protein [Marinomonas ostreistagni]